MNPGFTSRLQSVQGFFISSRKLRNTVQEGFGKLSTKLCCSHTKEGDLELIDVKSTTKENFVPEFGEKSVQSCETPE